MSSKENRFWSAIKITFNALKLYFMNIDKFFIYLLFPVIGSFLGLILVFTPTYYYAQNLTYLTQHFAFLNNTVTVLLVMLLICAPGFLLFCKAFWEYLLAMGALNSMALNLGSSGRISDTKIHRDIVKQRSRQYILLLLLLGLITCIPCLALVILNNIILQLLAMGILFLVTGLIWVYVSLSIQAFMLDESTNAIKAIKKSVLSVKYNFMSTVFVLLIIAILTYILLPELFMFASQKLAIDYKLSAPIESFLKSLPLNLVLDNPLLKQSGMEINTLQIAMSVILSSIGTIVMGFTLPIRAIICTQWYKLIEEDFKTDKVATKKSSKKNKEEE